MPNAVGCDGLMIKCRHTSRCIEVRRLIQRIEIYCYMKRTRVRLICCLTFKAIDELEGKIIDDFSADLIHTILHCVLG